MCDDKLRFHAGSGIFAVGVFDERMQKIGLSFAKGVASHGEAVFETIVRFVLAAIEEQSPDVTEAEGLICASVLVGGEFCKLFGEFAAHIVIAAREDHGACALCEARADLINIAEF